MEGSSGGGSIYSDLSKEGHQAVSMETTDYFVPDFVGVFGSVSECEYSRGCPLSVQVSVAQILKCKLKSAFFDCSRMRVFYQVIFMVEEHRIFFFFWESWHSGRGVVGGFASQLVTSIVAEVDD